MSNLQVIRSLGLKHGPVMLTIVPPSMLPDSGANIKGRFAPSVKYFEVNVIVTASNKNGVLVSLNIYIERLKFCIFVTNTKQVIFFPL